MRTALAAALSALAVVVLGWWATRSARNPRPAAPASTEQVLVDLRVAEFTTDFTDPYNSAVLEAERIIDDYVAALPADQRRRLEQQG